MKKYICEPCGYEYDPEVGDPDNGIAPVSYTHLTLPTTERV